MKSILYFFFSILLTTAILAPSVTIIMDADIDTFIIMDFNEEENNKEEKKEIGEQELFLPLHQMMATSKNSVVMCSTHFYIEGSYSTTSDVFLRPPKSL